MSPIHFMVVSNILLQSESQEKIGIFMPNS